jgi:hypothetical protein
MADQAMSPNPKTSLHRLHSGAALLALCGALCAAACSNPTGVTGPSGERLDTRVSATHVPLFDSIVVTLMVTNPSGHRLNLVYGSSVTYAQVTRGDTTFAAQVVLTGPDTISLAPDAQIALRPVALYILPLGAGALPVPTPGVEPLPLTPGVYDLAACAWVSGQTPDGIRFVPTCGPSVTFTVDAVAAIAGGA